MNIVIEGNIGAGKTSILEALQEQFIVKYEPKDRWTMLEAFYENPKTYAFPFQKQVMKSLRDRDQEKYDGIVIRERSLESAMKVFTREHENLGNVTMEQHEELKRKYKKYQVEKKDLIIYVKTAAEICAQRIKIRNRKEEEEIPIEYLRNLQKNHEEWLENEEIPVVIINNEITGVENAVQQCIQAIEIQRNEKWTEENEGLRIMGKIDNVKRNHADDVGIDMMATQDWTVRAGEQVTINSGIRLTPPKGSYIRIEPRSSLAKMGILVMGGIIDPGYTGEIRVMLRNVSKRDYFGFKGNAYAQMVCVKVMNPVVVKVQELPETKRGSKGFGSTNLK